MIDQETIAVYQDQAETYAKLVETQSSSNMLDLFAAKLPEQALILDLGCGPGHHSTHLRKMGFKVDPVDASAEMIKYANETYQLDARVARFDDLDEKEQYDGVWASFSLLHTSREAFPKHLEQIHNALKPEGTFYIGMKLGENAHRDRLGRFYTYYTEDELKAYLQTAGFTVGESYKGEEAGLSGDIAPFIELLTHKL